MGHSWATFAILALGRKETVQIRPRGNSMKGKVESGNLVTLAPITSPPEKGDIVLVKVGYSTYLHLIKAVQGDRYLIGNNRGGINGWTNISSIYGKAIRVEP